MVKYLWDGPSIKRERFIRGWSQKVLAGKLEDTSNSLGIQIPARDSVTDTIASWENDRHKPGDQYQMLLNAVLGERHVPVLESNEYEKLLILPSVESPIVSGLLLPELEQAFSLGSDELYQLRNSTEELRQLDRQGNAEGTVGIMKQHVDSLAGLFNACTKPKESLSLAKTLADTAAIAGWAALDRAHPRESWNKFQLSMNAAIRAGDRSLAAFASAQRAYVLIDQGKFDWAEQLVADVIQTDAWFVSSELAAWLYGAQAETAAANGNIDLCKRSLDLGRARLSYASSSGDCPYVVLDELHFERWAGSCLARLGDSGAIYSLERVRDEIHPDFARALGGVLVDLTQAYVAQGELDAAAKVFSAAYLTAGGTGSIRQLNRLRKMREEWPSLLPQAQSRPRQRRSN